MTARLDGETVLLHRPEWDQQEEALRQAARERRLVAPCCGKPVTVRWGMRKVRHFAHLPRARCPYERWSEPESAEHIAGKLLLYEWCQRHFGERLVRLELEFPLRETQQRPDIYLELSDGARMVIEYQRSPISLKEWTERHEGYRSLGLDDHWILGENRLQDALPTPEQQERWSRQEPHMRFLDLRAFENAASVMTPYEVAWWRHAEQDGLWQELELAARTGRELSPWYRRSALSRLRSLTFLDGQTGELQICRAMRELRGHLDTRMVSHTLRASLTEPAEGLTLTEHGFVTVADRAQLERHQTRAERVEAALAASERRASAEQVAEPAAAYQAGVEEQETAQRRLLEARAEVPLWRSMVDRLGLRPENLFFLVGVPIPGDHLILVHRTVWQAYVYYWLLRGRQTGSFPVRWIRGHLERRFGFHPELVRLATLIMPGRLNGPDEVIGAYLNLLAATGYLRNDHLSHHFRYHLPDNPPPLLAFRDRQQRHAAWAGLLAGRLRLEETALVGEGERIELLPVQQKPR